MKFITDMQSNICNLIASIAADRPVSAVYTDQDGVTSVRLIQPRNVHRADNGQTIVEAYDLNREATRKFRVGSFSYVAAPGEAITVTGVVGSAIA